MLMRELTRASNVAMEAVTVTAMHVRCIVGLVSALVTRAAQEVEDLVWDYQNRSGDLRDGLAGDGLDNVIPIDSRRRTSGYRSEPSIQAGSRPIR